MDRVHDRLVYYCYVQNHKLEWWYSTIIEYLKEKNMIQTPNCSYALFIKEKFPQVWEALAFPILYKELDEKSISKMVNEIYSEKNVVAPGCVNIKTKIGKCFIKNFIVYL